MLSIIYCLQHQAAEAEALAQRLRAKGEKAMVRLATLFAENEMENCDRVILFEGCDSKIEDAYQQKHISAVKAESVNPGDEQTTTRRVSPAGTGPEFDHAKVAPTDPDPVIDQSTVSDTVKSTLASKEVPVRDKTPPVKTEVKSEGQPMENTGGLNPAIARQPADESGPAVSSPKPAKK